MSVNNESSSVTYNRNMLKAYLNWHFQQRDDSIRVSEVISYGEICPNYFLEDINKHTWALKIDFIDTNGQLCSYTSDKTVGWIKAMPMFKNL